MFVTLNEADVAMYRVRLKKNEKRTPDENCNFSETA